MAIALNIIHLGESPFVVQQMQGDVDNTKVPAGTTLGTATQLGAAINDLATTPSGAGVLLPSNATSLEMKSLFTTQVQQMLVRYIPLWQLKTSTMQAWGLPTL